MPPKEGDLVALAMGVELDSGAVPEVWQRQRPSGDLVPVGIPNRITKGTARLARLR